jgi:hypothetical protein
MVTTYNYRRYKMSEYELGKFPGAKAGEIAGGFTVRDQGGNPVSLEDYKDKWVVLETGSLTCSMYVKNIPGIAKLQGKYPDVEFLLIYVREAHPGARLGPHETDAQKLEMSKQLQAIYHEPRKVLIDSVDGDMHRKYGALPNMTYVINPDGRVIYRCDWAFPKLIEKVLAGRDKLHTNEHVQIITAAPWIMVPVVLRGGWDALWDLIVALPFIAFAHLKADWVNFKNKIGAASS